VREPAVLPVERVAAFAHRDELVNLRAHWMRGLEGLVHVVSTQPADGLLAKHSGSELSTSVAVGIAGVATHHAVSTSSPSRMALMT